MTLLAWRAGDAVEQATAHLHDFYREEFRQVLRGMTARLATGPRGLKVRPPHII